MRIQPSSHRRRNEGFRQYWQAARRIASVLAQRHRQESQQLSWGDIAQQFSRFRRLHKRLELCTARNWHVAAGAVKKQIASVHDEFEFDLKTAMRQLEVNHQLPSSIATAGNIFRELMDTAEEFDDFSIVDGKYITARTDPITLEDTDFGPFEIRLEIAAMAKPGCCYRVIALQPNPARSRNEVTHPHVSDEILCEGEATNAISSAVAGGRIGDLFILIRNVLETYNPTSPFISIENWYGESCHECGSTENADDLHYCNQCNYDFCEGCISSCSDCEGYFCNSCLNTCPVCEERFCRECMTKCPDCGRSICKKCLEAGDCPCKEEREESDDSNNNSSIDTQQPVVAGGA